MFVDMLREQTTHTHTLFTFQVKVVYVFFSIPKQQVIVLFRIHTAHVPHKTHVVCI